MNFGDSPLGGPTSGRGIKTAMYHTLVCRVKFSTVVTLIIAICTVEAVIPPEKSRKRPANATPNILWTSRTPVLRFCSATNIAMLIKQWMVNSAVYATNCMKNFNDVSLTMPPTQGQKWSIFMTHLLTSRQWCVRSGLKFMHALHQDGLPS